MAVDPGTAQLMRDDLSALDGISEKKMFGGLGFMRGGHMLSGVMSTGALLYRVGKARQAQAQAMPGVGPMEHGSRTMGGFVTLTGEAMADDDQRATLLALALANAQDLPAKE
ncbi:TfoX/Sxy family protein [Paracoccus sp. M683]|uniref:TfoX/Sxy family protein n=1 Tax=Paracoccus sp. M683 TaxID=2594268 RepID=UPI0011813CA2|nr:TfoX/Sxy family protein [Paracoccus sp. M683]TRW95490.1 TfoX/Sxy family protein [Paracoccus sp. M683]